MAGVAPAYSPLSILRAPRPLIMIRCIRVFLKFSMPKARINQIFKRSSQQIYNVTIFFLFFMSLYGLLGVQGCRQTLFQFAFAAECRIWCKI